MLPEEKAPFIHRLRTACGHLNAIIHMVETGKPCEQIIHQLGAVQAAAREIGFEILKNEMHQSTKIILSSEDYEERITATQRVLELYELFYKKPIKSYME
jgi:DNA-binding FrmR family transcriptional regulator